MDEREQEKCKPDMNLNKVYFQRIMRLIQALVLLSAIFMSCSVKQAAVDSKDLSYLYNPTKSLLNPRYNVTNESENETMLAVKFFGDELYFSEANPQGVPMASILFTVKLFRTAQGRMLADTAYYNLSIIKEDDRSEYTYRVPLKVQPGEEYLAEVKILDRVRLHVIQAFIPFNTLSNFNRYNFRAQGHFGKNEIFNPVVRINEYVNLVYLRGYIDSLYVSYYKPYMDIPYPPSMLLPEKTIDYGPDTTIAIPYSDTIPMMFPRQGIYLISARRNINEGFTFLNLGSTFPSMTTPDVMIEPLTYLISENELNALRDAPRPKLALDEFWIKCGGNVEKARELIRIYYTRILYSNQYFTSFTEGWRTDRGMIYIIYGPPDKVYKSSEGESWGYRKPVIKSSWGTRYRVKDEYLFFNFRKKQNIFTENEYYLSRSETLVTLWDQAIASWKKGIVFRLDNPEEF
jgi:GWxTD domain-containing protein